MARRKKTTRQLALAEHDQRLPSWATLPEDCRREVVALLAKLLRSERAASAEEANDE
jgi:hypothetical protein